MAQTYAEFKAYVLTFMWRQNDADLTANLDVIIQQAHDELNVMTRDFQRRLSTTVIAPEVQDFDLSVGVPDFQSVRSLVNNNQNGRLMHHTIPSEVYVLRANNADCPLLNTYSVTRSAGTLLLLLVGSLSAENAGDLTLSYRAGIPNYAVTDESWLEDEYLNLYLYTVLKHIALFLREDERVQLYSGAQGEAFEKADIDDKHNLQFGGSPLRMQPTRHVP